MEDVYCLGPGKDEDSSFPSHKEVSPRPCCSKSGTQILAANLAHAVTGCVGHLNTCESYDSNEMAIQPDKTLAVYPLWTHTRSSPMYEARTAVVGDEVKCCKAVAQDLLRMKEVEETSGKRSGGAWGTTVHYSLMNYALSPNTFGQLFWQMIGVLLICWDMVYMPLSYFQLPEDLYTKILTFVQLVYWTLDILRVFVTGYYDDGNLIMSRPQIARRYLKSWFVPDLTVVVLDYTLLIVQTDMDAGRTTRMGRALRSLRFLRVVRLFRCVKLLHLMKGALNKIHSVRKLVLLKGLYIFLAIALLSHYIACYWFAIGTRRVAFSDEQTATWVEVYGLDHESPGRIYLISLQWALGQCGLAPDRIYPTNSLERLYACFVSSIWLIVISVTTSFFAIWQIQIREAYKEYNSQESMLRAFLGEHNVSMNLTDNIVGFFQRNYKSRMRNVQASDIVFLRDLPMSLQINMNTQIYLPHLTKHPLFLYLHQLDTNVLHSICHLAMDESHYLAGSEVFSEGLESANAMYLCGGTMDYCRTADYINDIQVQKVEGGTWICEMSLWTPWITKGRLVANTSCKAVVMDSSKLRNIMACNQCDVVMRFVCYYAKKVTEFLERTGLQSDIWQDLLEEEVIQGLVQETAEALHLETNTDSAADFIRQAESKLRTSDTMRDLQNAL